MGDHRCSMVVGSHVPSRLVDPQAEASGKLEIYVTLRRLHARVSFSTRFLTPNDAKNFRLGKGNSLW